MKFQDKKFIFAGNRAFVYEAMVELGLNISKIFAVNNSYFSRYLKEKNIDFEEIEDKKSFINELFKLNFDYFISNGLPIILPISKLKENTNKEFINIHPSYLPDLRGADPVHAALLFNRDSGATCHYMDDGIDSGKIISQLKIGNTPDLEAGLLWQLVLKAEKDVFKMAFQRNFESICEQELSGNLIYYTFKDDDLRIDFNQTAEKIIQRVKAFSTTSKGAYFVVDNEKYIVFDAEIISNDYLNSMKDKFKELEIVIRYENCIIFKKDNLLIKFKSIKGDISKLTTGYFLS